MKTCGKCGESKGLEAFYAEARAADGLRGHCKACDAERRRDWRARNNDHERAYRRKYYAGNRDRIRGHQRQAKYGLAPDAYQELVRQQDGRCAVCGTSDTGAVHKQALCVDHNHETGAVRGLLCDPCNRAIGLLGDSPDRIFAAALYLLTHEGAPSVNLDA